MNVVAIVFELIGEAVKLGASAYEASQEQLADATARCTAALEALRGVRAKVESNIDARHAEAHRLLDTLDAHTDPAVAAIAAQLRDRFATPLPAPGLVDTSEK